MNLYQTAVDLADQAVPTFPCANDKTPIPKRGFHAATLDHAPGDWERAALVGMPTGAASGYDVLDIDPRHGGDVWFRDHAHELPVTRTVTTLSGGRHLYFNSRPELRCSVSKIAPGVDVRADGGYVIRWDAAGYPTEHPETVADWPEWLFQAGVGHRVRHAADSDRDVSAPSVGIAVSLLSAMPNPESADRDVYLRVMLAARGCGDDEDIAEAAVQWACRWPGSPGYDVEMEKWERDFATRDAPLAGWPNLLAAAARLGVDVSGYRVASATEFGTVTAGPALQVIECCGNAHWQAKILTNDKGAPIASIANALLALREAPAWAGVVGYDEFRARAAFIQPPPWHTGVFEVRQVQDHDITRAAEWLHVQGIRVATSVVAEAIHAVSREAPFHPVRAYLHSLQWDGVPRIDSWMIDHLGAEDTDLNRAFGGKFLISAVARIMKPGCQVDTMLVLEGRQGIRKSTALRVLTGCDWFTDNLPDLSTKDAVQQLQGIWILEHAELATLGKADASRAKEFISRRVDRFRPSYGRVADDFPRQCVFAATVNPGGLGYLKDETGARRFWPVSCGVGWSDGREVDAALLSAARDQIWAEATARLASGEPWWLDARSLQVDQEAATEQRYDADIWTDLIRDIVENEQTVRSIDVLADSRLAMRPQDMNKAAQMRVTGVLKALGWTRSGCRARAFDRPVSWPAVRRKADADDMESLAS